MKTNLQEVRNVVCDARLDGEELETVIAPGISVNHNETFLAAASELEAEELEAVIAPKANLGWPNHNETFLGAAMELQAEELEAVIAPSASLGGHPRNHNETFLPIL